MNESLDTMKRDLLGALARKPDGDRGMSYQQLDRLLVGGHVRRIHRLGEALESLRMDGLVGSEIRDVRRYSITARGRESLDAGEARAA